MHNSVSIKSNTNNPVEDFYSQNIIRVAYVILSADEMGDTDFLSYDIHERLQCATILVLYPCTHGWFV